MSYHALAPSHGRYAIRRSTVVAMFFALVCANAGSLLIRSGLQSEIWMLIYGATALWCLHDWGRTKGAFWMHAVVFLPPLYAILSTFWSIAPMQTAWSGVQFLMTTIIAVRIAMSIDPKRALVVAGGVYAVGISLSLLNVATGFMAPVWEHNGALLGIYTQKNMMGKAAVMGGLILVGLARLYRIPLLPVVIYIGLFAVVRMAMSAGALMTYLLVPALFFLAMVSRRSAQVRAVWIIFPLLALTLVGLAYVGSGGSPITALLEFTGKSPTLTGRTVIWQFGLESFREHPLLGVGFKAYWAVDSFAIRYIHATIEDGLFWFHNIYIEMLVGGGILGAAIMALVIVRFLRQALRWIVRSGSVVAILWGMILLVSLFAGLSDNVTFTLHGLNHVLIVMGYVFATRALREQL
ncbi:O-antigen ligase family protein [Celeribacter arenosi]